MNYRLKRFYRGEDIVLTQDDITPKAVPNGAVSDLWFNHDHSDSKGDDGDFDINKMLRSADGFSDTLRMAGIGDAPTGLELVADFFHRL